MTAKKPAPAKPTAKTKETEYRPTVGDVVKIVKDVTSHMHKIGSIHTIRTDDKGTMPYQVKGSDMWFEPEEVELVTKAADVVKVPKVAKPKPTAKASKYPAPRVASAAFDATKIRKDATRDELRSRCSILSEDLTKAYGEIATTGTKLDRALVDLKEAKKRIKELEAAK